MIKESIKKLIHFTDVEWGNYAFSRDPLNGKLSREKREEMILNANQCGKEEARKLKSVYGEINIKEYARKLNLKIHYEDLEGSDNYIVFGRFNYPDKITIYNGNIHKANKFIEENEIGELLEYIDITSVLLAHEMFHYIEEHNDTIYTRTEKIQLWKLGPLKNNSRLIAVGEIAAMAFAKELAGISYSPYIFDVIMLYPHNKEKTQKLVNEIVLLSQE